MSNGGEKARTKHERKSDEIKNKWEEEEEKIEQENELGYSLWRYA